MSGGWSLTMRHFNTFYVMTNTCTFYVITNICTFYVITNICTFYVITNICTFYVMTNTCTFYVMTDTRHCAMSAIQLSLTSNTCEEAVSYLHSKEVILVSTQIQTDQRALLFYFLYHSPALKKQP